jgi:hypothetical protein
MSQRLSVTPRQAAALDRLLDAYVATDEHDPGLPDLVALREKVGRLEHDHSAYAKP